MCARINTACCTAHYGDPRRCNPLGELHRRSLAVCSEFTRTDDTNPTRIWDKRTAMVKDKRRVEDLAQDVRIERIVYGNQFDLLPQAVFRNLLRQSGVHTDMRGQILGECLREQPERSQLHTVHRPNITHGRDRIAQAAHTHASDLPTLQECRQIIWIFHDDTLLILHKFIADCNRKE